MEYTLKCIFLPDTIYGRSGKEFSIQALKALNLYFESPYETVTADSKNDAAGIMFERYAERCGIPSPRVEVVFVDKEKKAK